jgi:hypothetical protein
MAESNELASQIPLIPEFCIRLGSSVSLSFDGNTLAIGDCSDNGNIGATWIFTRNGTVWPQQGKKLVGSQSSGCSNQGASVSLSSDGNTLAVGGFSDNNNTGAIWIFTRNGTTWTQQGDKLVGSQSSGQSCQGQAISLSSDGNTLAVGGFSDNNNIGATWIFTRSESTWTQQGEKLVGSVSGGSSSNQGRSVSLSSDGNTLAIGGYANDNTLGATWIFTRSESTWTQECNKLVGTSTAGEQSVQGISVSLSCDGNILAIGGPGDNNNLNATWMFTRNGTIWTQEGDKLVGSGSSGQFGQGVSVSLSSDGNKLAVGGFADNNFFGATWIFTRNETTWTQRGNKLNGSGSSKQSIQGVSVFLSSDGHTIAVGGPCDEQQNGQLKDRCCMCLRLLI